MEALASVVRMRREWRLKQWNKLRRSVRWNGWDTPSTRTPEPEPAHDDRLDEVPIREDETGDLRILEWLRPDSNSKSADCEAALESVLTSGSWDWLTRKSLRYLVTSGRLNNEELEHLCNSLDIPEDKPARMRLFYKPQLLWTPCSYDAMFAVATILMDHSLDFSNRAEQLAHIPSHMPHRGILTERDIQKHGKPLKVTEALPDYREAMLHAVGCDETDAAVAMQNIVCCLTKEDEPATQVQTYVQPDLSDPAGPRRHGPVTLADVLNAVR